MEITREFLRQCEELIAMGDAKKAIDQLLDVQDKTAYKTHLLNISNRWKKFNSDQIIGRLSSESESQQTSQLNDDLLRLIAALERELDGESFDKSLFSQNSSAHSHPTILQKYLPLVLTALAVWGICFFAYRQPKSECKTNEKVDINGEWTIISEMTKEQVGFLNIRHKKCQSYLEISGGVKTLKQPSKEVDFSSKIAGINDGEILFVYENFDGEIGLCRGIAPLENDDQFSVRCTDLSGFNKDGKDQITLTFNREK